MSDQDKPNPRQLPIDTDKVQETIDDVRRRAEASYDQAPPEVKQAVEKSQSFYQSNKEAIHTVLFIAIVLKLNKRMTKKVVESALDKALNTTPVTIDVARYMDDYQAWYKDAKNFAKEW